MARRAVGLTVTSAVNGRAGLRGGGHVADPVNGAGVAAAAAAIAVDSLAITATAALIATDNTNLTTDVTTNLGGDNTAVEDAVAALEGDPPDQGSAAHVATLRTVWNTMKGHLTTLGTHRTSLGTHSGTATSDAVDLASDSDDLTAGVAPTPAATDVVLSYDTTAVGNRSQLRLATLQLLDGVAASNDFAS
jgi:hypothetical protein